jgi:hypothetical protein
MLREMQSLPRTTRFFVGTEREVSLTLERMEDHNSLEPAALRGHLNGVRGR